jgi:hypothetical protein
MKLDYTAEDCIAPKQIDQMEVQDILEMLLQVQFLHRDLLEWGKLPKYFQGEIYALQESLKELSDLHHIH